MCVWWGCVGFLGGRLARPRRLRMQQLWQRKAAARARELVRSVPFDVAHHATFSAFWLPMGVVGLGIPTVVGPVGGATTTPAHLARYLGPKGRLFDETRKANLNARRFTVARSWAEDVRVIISQNREMSSFARTHLNRSDAVLIPHPHASDPEVPAHGKTARSTEFVFVGRLLPWKGGALALKAFEEAGLDDGHIFTFIGSGPDGRRLRRYAHRLGLDNRVSFAGQLDRQTTVERIRASAGLVFPSFHDSAGFVVAEAAALGTPVVCLDHGGPGQLVRLWPKTPGVAVDVAQSETKIVSGLAQAIRQHSIAAQNRITKLFAKSGSGNSTNMLTTSPVFTTWFPSNSPISTRKSSTTTGLAKASSTIFCSRA